MGKLIHDITPAPTKWHEWYAHAEYMRIVWNDLWSPTTYIEVVEEKPWSKQLKEDIAYIESFK